MNRITILFGATFLYAGAQVTQTVHAQTEAAIAPPSSPVLTEVVVTGSLVGQSDATSPSPVSVITARDITDTGVLSLADVIRRDPAASAASRGADATLNGGGETGINLRNLGLQRTLVLINGHRYAPTSDELGNAAQDVGAIPTGMIDRIDILRDGAATTYGADAVAGVVNIILKDKYNGFDVNGYYGISGHGDGRGYRVDSTLGVANDRGSVLFTIERQDQDGIQQNQRSWSSNLITGIGATAPTLGSSNTPGGRVLGSNGSIIACYNPGSTVNLVGQCPRYDASPEQSLTLGLGVTSIGGVAHYDLTSDIRFNVNAFYTDRKSDQNISGSILNTSSNTPPYNSGYAIAATSPNNPFGVPVYLQWRLSPYGERTDEVDQREFWSTGGFSGQILDRFNWDVSGTYSQTNANNDRLNSLNNVYFYNLLNPSVCAADPICKGVGAVGNIANLLNGTTPLTAAQRQYAFATGIENIRNVSEQVLASINGPLFDLPAGAVKGALGVEHRIESGQVLPDGNYIQGVYGSQVFPTDGRYWTNEGFAELGIPILKDAPFAKALDLDVQGRYSHFSNFGGATTKKFGLNYSPVEDVRFRATYGTSFRAPSVLEVYGGGVGATGAIGDPCAATGVRSTNAVVAANCAALGVPANYTPPPSIPTRSGGNPSLQPETGKSFTAGVVLEPRFLPRLTLTADYFNFIIHNTIGQSDITTLMAQCYADPTFLTRANNPSDVCYGYNVRGPAGDLGRINNPQINLPGSTQTSGVDFAARYIFETLGLGGESWIPGSVNVNLQGSYLKSYMVSGVQYAGSFQSGVSGSSANPRWQGIADLDYVLPNWTFRFETQYTGAMRDFYAGISFPVVNYRNYTGVPNYFLNNALIKWKTPFKNTDLSLGVNNVFDKNPPYAFVSTRNSLYLYDAVGRYFFVTVGMKF
jgi:outer membrane receptor protein involved in Fe transport